MAIITISREMGSGGIPIAHKAAEKLGYTLVDGDAIRRVAEDYGLTPESLEKAAEINHLPCRIVQGRYDMCCPATSAWELCRAMPRADLRMVPDAGHSALEPGIASELIRATDDFKELYA